MRRGSGNKGSYLVQERFTGLSKNLHLHETWFEVVLKSPMGKMISELLKPFPCLTARFYGYYDASIVGLYRSEQTLCLHRNYHRHMVMHYTL
jgi:hypothetical protein